MRMWFTFREMRSNLCHALPSYFASCAFCAFANAWASSRETGTVISTPSRVCRICAKIRALSNNSQFAANYITS